MNPRSIRGQHAASTTQSPPPASPLSSARPAMATTLLVLMLMAAVQLVATARVTHGCQISEFACRGGALCLPLDKYCDGRDDCGDASDEPKFCTVCNRTYYGDIGRTYSLRVPPPQWNRLPFLCHITFTASGREQGDIVQIIFDGFSVGRFDEGLVDMDAESSDLSSYGDLPGCPDGFMQLSELGRPFTGGSWCGAATGPQQYYSETSTVTASVKVFHTPLQAATPFEFRIRYKFISQSDAIVRYGPPNEQLNLGRVMPGTYCTRQMDECYRSKCRLQSPNYPGMYPRNVTCYWTIREKTVPTCKHAMIAVSQENAHKALVKRSIASLNKTFRSIRAWSDCTGERDHLIFYDGSSTNDPVLAKYCGGDWLPRVIARGPEMLVAFHSSPFSAPLQSNIPNRGFELDVDVLFADSDSYDYARTVNKGACEFHINASNPDDVLFSRRGRMGKIHSPRHTLPPNTTCTYHFHGQPRDLVWLSFTSYNLQILQHANSVQDNSSTLDRAELPPWITRLRIWDSAGTSVNIVRTGTTASSSSHGGGGKSYSQQQSEQQQQQQQHQQGGPGGGVNNGTNYYYYNGGSSGGSGGVSARHGDKNIKVNVDNAWNPVDSYIYGPTPNTVFNQEPGSSTSSSGAAAQHKVGVLTSSSSSQQQKFEKFGNMLTGAASRDAAVNYAAIAANHNARPGERIGQQHHQPYASLTAGGQAAPGAGTADSSGTGASSSLRSAGGGGGGSARSQKYANSRKLIVELYDNETPRLCDHSQLEEGEGEAGAGGTAGSGGVRMRPCSPLESYVSGGRDMKVEFHTHTGTALYPATFALRYEFVDTDLGGEPWPGRRGEQPPVPALCSRVFRHQRQGTVQSPRNVFLHGRGGAKNLTCLYRFEAGVGERIRLTLHNVSFGESATCTTEPDPHTGRPQCVQSTTLNPYVYDPMLSTGSDSTASSSTSPPTTTTLQRQNELRIFDVPFRDVRHSLGCFCDNTTSLYSSPLVVQSLSRTMELSFAVSRLNISEDFADIFFYASYEFVAMPDCPRRQRLRGAGGEASASFPDSGGLMSAGLASMAGAAGVAGVPITTILSGGSSSISGMPPSSGGVDEELAALTGNAIGTGFASGSSGAGGIPAAAVASMQMSMIADCENAPWYVEAQRADRSLFLLTWGTFLPHGEAAAAIAGGETGTGAEDAFRCSTRNRLVVYAGRPLRVVRVICPTVPGPRPTALRIFSEDWLGAGTMPLTVENGQPLPAISTKFANFVIEPVLREPGNIAFQWMEIQRTRASLLQQLDVQTNDALNETLSEFGFDFRGPEVECEYKCPELNACIDRDLWCDGQLNCPSGYDESEEECGTARRLLELPGGMFAAFGCLAAAITACLIFCVFGLVRRKRKSNAAKLLLNGSASASASASSASTLHRQHQQQHHYHHPLGSGAGLGGGGLGTYHPGSTAGTLRREKHSGIGGYGKKDSLFMDVDGPTS